MMIHEWNVSRHELEERAVGCDFYPERGKDTCFQYDFFIPEAEWFHQDPQPATAVYWISISARYDTTAGPIHYPWGWKTREHYYNDDAVRIFEPHAPTVNMVFGDGQPIEEPQDVSWDMAFELTTIEIP